MSTIPTNGGTVLTVGPGQEYSSITAAVTAAQNGDTIDVQAGTYTNNFVDTGKSLTLQAVGGVVKMEETESPPDGKAMITEGGTGVNFTITGFDIGGVSVASSLGGNGAAVRYQGGNLTLNNDDFHNNQDGILGNPPTAGQGSVTINDSEFADNGSGTGRTHNIYIGDVASLTIDNSYIHDANVGHEVKSRAENTTIINSRIFDNNSTASYSIDLPNGGNATITKDVIQQGPNSQNPIIISYGEEGNLHAGTDVRISNDTIVNALARSPLGIRNATRNPITVSSDQVYGLTSSDLTSGPANVSGITYLSSRPPLDTSSNWQPSGSTPAPTPTPVPPPAPTPSPTPTPTPTATASDLSVVLPAALMVTAGSTIAISGLSISDAWAAGNPGSLALNVWDGSGAGKITIGGQTSSGIKALHLAGSLSRLNADLAALSFTAGPPGTDGITVDVWNQAGVEVTKTLKVNIGAGAPAPTPTPTPIAAPSGSPNDLAVTAPGAEGVAAASTIAISGLSIHDPWGATNAGTMALNVWDDSGNGTVSLAGHTSSGTAEISLTGTEAQLNAALATLTYKAGAAGSDGITVNVWNQAGVAVTKTIDVTVGARSSPRPTPTVTLDPSTYSTVESVSGTVVQATAGDHVLFIGGTGNAATLTGGNETVMAFQGSNAITTGAGNDTIRFAGSGNTINAGAGHNILADSGSNNTLIMPSAGGMDDIYGYVLQNGDKLDFASALKGTAWDGSAATLSDFLHVSSPNGADALVAISATAKGPAVTIADLHGAHAVSLSTLLAHAIV